MKGKNKILNIKFTHTVHEISSFFWGQIDFYKQMKCAKLRSFGAWLRAPVQQQTCVHSRCASYLSMFPKLQDDLKNVIQWRTEMLKDA